MSQAWSINGPLRRARAVIQVNHKRTRTTLCPPAQQPRPSKAGHATLRGSEAWDGFTKVLMARLYCADPANGCGVGGATSRCRDPVGAAGVFGIRLALNPLVGSARGEPGKAGAPHLRALILANDQLVLCCDEEAHRVSHEMVAMLPEHRCDGLGGSASEEWRRFDSGVESRRLAVCEAESLEPFSDANSGRAGLNLPAGVLCSPFDRGLPGGSAAEAMRMRRAADDDQVVLRRIVMTCLSGRRPLCPRWRGNRWLSTLRSCVCVLPYMDS